VGYFFSRVRCAHLLETYKDVLSRLANKPVHLKDFANQVQVIAGYREQEKNLYKQTSQVDQLYNLLQQYEVKIPSEDLVLHEDLHERQQEYRREIEVAQNYRDTKMPEMVANVETNILKLQDQIGGTVAKLEDPLFVEVDAFGEPDKVLEELAQLGARLENADQLAKTYASYQKLFGVSVAAQKELESGKERYDTLRQLWETTKSWTDKQKVWLDSQFTELQVEEVDKEVQQFFKDSFALQKKLNNKASELLKDKVTEFKTMMPNILDLGNPNMRPRHFEKIFRLIDENYYPDMPFSLSFLLKAGVMNHKESVQEISGAASGEAQLEASLDKIKNDWEKQVFTVLNHRDQHGLYILGSLEEVFVLLEDHQVSLQTMLGSRYVRGVQDRVDEWEKKLSVLSETLDEWLLCQRSWMYLENIFGAEDIQKQLPAESQKFLIVDRSWKNIMQRTHTDPKVLSALFPLESGATLLDTFLMNNEALESIQKSLEEYLETKRMAFPRFYFLSNDELLEIMSQTRDPRAVQPHMSKCFDAIKRIKFGEGRQGHDILGFLDPSGEYVPLSDSVKAEGPVEVWLKTFEKAMRQTLYDRSKQAYLSYPKTEQESIFRKDWLWSAPAQVVIAIDQVIWTMNVTFSLIQMEGLDEKIPLNPRAMDQFLHFSLRQIDAMVDLVRAPLDKQQRTLLGALLTIDVHARDVIRTLVSKRTRQLTDFEWTKQLRYYWDEKEDDIFAKQTNSSFRYGYEYLGNGPRLVITPLTDTCYMYASYLPCCRLHC
jgi:dynein heavy chain, axonemal